MIFPFDSRICSPNMINLIEMEELIKGFHKFQKNLICCSILIAVTTISLLFLYYRRYISKLKLSGVKTYRAAEEQEGEQ